VTLFIHTSRVCDTRRWVMNLGNIGKACWAVTFADAP
jgi:hypothetical protein